MKPPASFLVLLVGGLLGLSVAAAGCTRSGDRPAGSWTALGKGDLSEAQAVLAKAASDARDALGQRLLSELTGALDSGGPAAAIRVCKERAPAIAAEVGAAGGVKIGRTSFRLRNPSNAPPDWAVESLAEKPTEPVHVDLAERGLGALFPIVTAAPCVGCHGASESLAPEVAQALETDYPADRATGFQVGELRGWFWVEVPPSATVR
jgi:hypothetical protein